MTDSCPPSELTPPPQSGGPDAGWAPRKRPRHVWITGICVGLLGSVGSMWFFQTPTVISEPVHFSRTPDGQLAPVQPREEGNRLQVDVHAGKLEARNSTSTSSAESHHNPAFLAARTLAVFSRSDHLLMHQTMTALLERLKADSRFDAITYYPPGHKTELGTRSPDLFLTLDLLSIEESGLIGRDLTASVTASFGTSLAAASTHYVDNQSPPTIRMRGSIRVDHQSTLTGVESSAARYSRQGDSIAEAVASQLLGKLSKLDEKHDALPELPATLYPKWSPAPDFPFLRRLQAVRLSGHHGLMYSNESCWQFQPAGDPLEDLQQLRDELLADDWKESSFETSSARHLFLRMIHGDQVIEVFPRRRESGSRVPGPDTRTPQPEHAPAYCIRYRHRLPTGTVRTVIDSLLDADSPDINVLLALRNFCHSDQYARMVEVFEQRPVRHAEAWLMVADYYARRQEVDVARRALASCRFLAKLMADQGTIQNRLKSIARKIDVDLRKLNIPETESAKSLGFVQLDPDTDPAGTVMTNLNEPAVFVLNNDDGTVTVYSYTVSAPSAQGQYRIQSVELHHHSRSWSSRESSSLQPLATSRHDNVIIRATAQEISPGRLQIDVTAERVQPVNNDAEAATSA